MEPIETTLIAALICGAIGALAYIILTSLARYKKQKTDAEKLRSKIADNGRDPTDPANLTAAERWELSKAEKFDRIFLFVDIIATVLSTGAAAGVLYVFGPNWIPPEWQYYAIVGLIAGIIAAWIFDQTVIDAIATCTWQDKTRKAHSGPSAHLGIDSAAFNLAVLAGFQNTCLDQSYYYGSGCHGNWGYKDGLGTFNKSYWSLKIFGDIVSGYTDKVSALSTVPSVTVFAGLSADKKRGFALISDYRGKGTLTASVKGMEGARVVSAQVLDHTRDLEPVDVEWKDGTLTLPRKDENSAAFLVVFERAPGA